MRQWLVLLFVLARLYTQGQNLVLNPGFENGLANWTTNTNAPTFVTIAIDGSISHTGQSSLRININDSVGAFGLVSQFFLQTGGHYILEWYVKTDSLVNGGAFPYTIIYRNGQRLYGEAGYSVNETTNGWQKHNYRFYMPANTDTLQLLIAAGASNGSAWFDDISLTQLTDTVYQQFSVALDSQTGTSIRPFTSTNVGPVDPVVSTLNLNSQFEKLGIEYVRTHDFQGPCDMHIIFPDTTRRADDSSAYNFFWTDSVIKPIIASGSKVYFRLGESGTVDTALYDVPHDMNKWAQVAAHIALHYNQGWNHGFHFDIKYWEIFNEPDLGWNGTVQQYITLYRLASAALKNTDSTFQIGGPAISSLTNTGFLYPFLDSVNAESLAFDFFSYHYYHTYNPYDFVRYDAYAKQILTKFNLGSTPRIVSEWSNYNYNSGNNYFVWRNDPFIAASCAAALSYYQNTDVFKLMRYRTDGTDLGMFDAMGNYNYTGLMYYYMSNFRAAPNRLQTTGGDTLGTSILAGAATGGQLAGILIADNCSGANGYNLAINGIGSSEQYKFQIYRIDSNIISVPVDSGIVTAINNRIIQAVKPPYTDFIVMTASVINSITSIPPSGTIYAYPNPFSDVVMLHVNMPATNIKGIFIMDLLGNILKTFPAEEFKHTNVLQWNGLADNGKEVTGGLYFIKFWTDAEVYQVTLIKE